MLNQFGSLYSQYYDLLYKDKDYIAEVNYIESLIPNFENIKNILDLGCGTGKHSEIFCNKGLTVHGVDLSSEMLKVAESRRLGKEDKLTFSQSDISNLNLGITYNVIVSLFHVMSYINSNIELVKAFEVIKKHLNKDGFFIFDFWYGPAVLTDLPVTRIKRLENENIRVTRIAEPKLHCQKNIVDVNYDVFIENKLTKEVEEKKEIHKMRYFFDTELELICQNTGFKILNKYRWMSKVTPDFNSWYAVWVITK